MHHPNIISVVQSSQYSLQAGLCVGSLLTVLGQVWSPDELHFRRQLNKYYIKLCVNLKTTVKINFVDCDHYRLVSVIHIRL